MMTLQKIVLLVLAAALALPLAAAAQPAPATAPAGTWNPDVFPISFWCGPPKDFVKPERFKQIADAGFTYCMPPCGPTTPEMNKQILDDCQQAGIKAFIADSRMPIGIGPNGEGKEKIDAIVADYKDHPALAGYHITDEPWGGAFPALAQTVAYLREKDPQHIAYINLFPNYAPLSALATPTYDDHVEAFAATVKPALISYDHYHFHNKYDAPGFFANLKSVRNVALRHNLPFWNIVLLINHFDYRSPTEAELRWEAMQTLAFGGKGVMYFTYWQPDASGNWGEAIINHDGTPTKKYEQVKRINHDVQAIGKNLLHATSVSAFEFGQPGDVTNTGGDQPVSFAGPRISVGYFHAPENRRLVLFANRDYRHETTCDVRIDTAGKPLEKLDKASGQWQPAEVSRDKSNVAQVRLNLAAGDADLYRWIAEPPPAKKAE